MPFTELPNTACLVCDHVLNQHVPISFVSHDIEDGAWQFLCDANSHDEENVSVIALHRAIALDATLELLADLPLGYVATRQAPDQSWQKRQAEDDN